MHSIYTKMFLCVFLIHTNHNRSWLSFSQLMPEEPIHVLVTLRDWLSDPEDTLKFENHRAFSLLLNLTILLNLKKNFPQTCLNN